MSKASATGLLTIERAMTACMVAAHQYETYHRWIARIQKALDALSTKALEPAQAFYMAQAIRRAVECSEDAEQRAGAALAEALVRLDAIVQADHDLARALERKMKEGAL